MRTLQQLLKDKNIKLSEFARRIDATSQQVSNWFSRGNIPKKYVKPISNVLNITLNEALILKAS